MGKVGGVRKDNGGFWVFHVDCAKRCLTVPQLMVHNSLRWAITDSRLHHGTNEDWATKCVVVRNLVTPPILEVDFLQRHKLVLDFVTSPVSIRTSEKRHPPGCHWRMCNSLVWFPRMPPRSSLTTGVQRPLQNTVRYDLGCTPLHSYQQISRTCSAPTDPCSLQVMDECCRLSQPTLMMCSSTQLMKRCTSSWLTTTSWCHRSVSILGSGIILLVVHPLLRIDCNPTPQPDTEECAILLDTRLWVCF